MPYTPNIINNNQPVFEELDEFVGRLLKTVVAGSTSGDLGTKAVVDQAFSETNLANLTNSGISTLISFARDNNNLNNWDMSQQAISLSKPIWGYVYNIYIRLDARRNNQAKLERVVKEIRDAVCYNDLKDNNNQSTYYSETLLVSDGWSGKTYKSYLNKNKQIGQPLFVKEPMNKNLTYYTAVLSILFYIHI